MSSLGSAAPRLAGHSGGQLHATTHDQYFKPRAKRTRCYKTVIMFEPENGRAEGGMCRTHKQKDIEGNGGYGLLGPAELRSRGA